MTDIEEAANRAVSRVADRANGRGGSVDRNERGVYALEAIALELNLIRRSGDIADPDHLELAGVIALAGVREALVKELNKLRYRKIAFDGRDTVATRVVSLDSMARAVERVIGVLPAPIEGVPADSSET